MIINEVFTAALAISVSYIIGSFPTAYVVARLRKGVDIREIGTRNMGAMNVLYKIGIAEGLVVLTTDIGKGAAAVFFGSLSRNPRFNSTGLWR